MTVVNGYCTVDELRAHLGDTALNLDEDLMAQAINAASRAIDRHCGRRFWQDQAVQAKVYRPDDAYEADVDDISTTDGLIVETDSGDDGTWATTWAADDYQLEPLNADTDNTAHAWWRIVAVGGRLFPVYRRRVSLRVTAQFGWSVVPDDVTEACLLKSAALFMRREAPHGVAGFNQFGPVRISREDKDLQMLLHPFVKIGVWGV